MEGRIKCAKEPTPAAGSHPSVRQNRICPIMANQKEGREKRISARAREALKLSPPDRERTDRGLPVY